MPVFDEKKPAVYCTVDREDRYALALLNDEAHVYAPRHYLVKFEPEKASSLKCMKAKLNQLVSSRTPTQTHREHLSLESVSFNADTLG